MADDKKPAPLVNVELVATRAGFHANRFVKVGQAFTFSGPKCPSWAVPAAEAKPVPKAKPLNGDTKPADARAAVNKKAAQAAGTDLA